MGVRSVNNSALQALGGAAAHLSAPASRPQTADAATVRAASEPAGRSASSGIAPKAPAGPEPDRKVQQAAKGIEVVLNERSGTRLRIDTSTHQVVAQILDRNNQVIKQIPPEKALKIAAKLREFQGKIFDESV